METKLSAVSVDALFADSLREARSLVFRGGDALQIARERVNSVTSTPQRMPAPRLEPQLSDPRVPDHIFDARA